MIRDEARAALPWLALFLLFFILFLTFFWAEAWLKTKAARLMDLAAARDIELKGVAYGLFPPRARLSSVDFPVGGSRVILTDCDMGLDFFPTVLKIRGRVLGGEMEIAADVRLSLPPEIGRINFRVHDLSVALLPPGLRNNAYAEIEGGRIGAEGWLNDALAGGKINWKKLSGELNIKLADGECKILPPVLKNGAIKGAGGRASLLFKGAAIDVQACRIEAAPMSFEAQGRLSDWRAGLASGLRLETELAVPADWLNADLIPPRSLEKLRRSGVVRAAATGSLGQPVIRLEN